MNGTPTITALCYREDIFRRSYHFSTPDGLNFEWPSGWVAGGKGRLQEGSWYTFSLLNGSPKSLLGPATSGEIKVAKRGRAENKVETTEQGWSSGKVRLVGDNGFTLALRPAMLTMFVGA